jgi:hypothetical protein
VSIKHVVTPIAETVPFDNATNGFVADEVQSAIEETKSYNEGFPRSGVVLTANGTVSTGNWITYTELLANPRIVFPVGIRLKEMTFNNSNTSLRALNFTIYKNGQDAGNIVHVITPTAGQRTAGYGYYVWPSDIDFVAGDIMYVRVNYTASGTSLSDLGLVIWISRIP